MRLRGLPNAFQPENSPVPPVTTSVLIHDFQILMRFLVLKLRANCKTGCKSQNDTW